MRRGLALNPALQRRKEKWQSGNTDKDGLTWLLADQSLAVSLLLGGKETCRRTRVESQSGHKEAI